MSYLSDNSQFDSNTSTPNSYGEGYQVHVESPGPNSSAPQPQNFNIPGENNQPMTNTSSGVTGDQGSGGANGAGGAPAWTNIQAYLKANQGASNGIQNFKDDVNNVANQERGNMAEWNNTYYDDLSSAKYAAERVYQNGSDPAANLGVILDSYGGKPVDTQWEGALRDVVNTNYNELEPGTYQTGNRYNELMNTVSDEGLFKEYMGRLNEESIGAPMSSGQKALQNQLDLSGGNYGDARSYAMERLAGIAPDAEQMNTSLQGLYSDGMAAFQPVQDKIKGDIVNSDNQKIQEWYAGTFDPSKYNKPYDPNLTYTPAPPNYSEGSGGFNWEGAAVGEAIGSALIPLPGVGGLIGGMFGGW